MSDRYEPPRADVAAAQVTVADAGGAEFQVTEERDAETPVGVVVRTDSLTLRTYLSNEAANQLAVELTRAVDRHELAEERVEQ
jgi:hypothetical protein